MSFLDKIKAKYDGKLEKEAESGWRKYTEEYLKMKCEIDEARAKEAAKWATIYTTTTTTSPSPVTGGFPLGVGTSGTAWLEEVALSGRCKMLMKKLNITTVAEFDKVFGEIIND